MTMATWVFSIALVLGGVAAIKHADSRARQTMRVPRLGRLLAFVVTVFIVGALMPLAIEDSGGAAVYLLGVPLLAAILPLASELSGYGERVTTFVAAVVMSGWGLLLGLGFGAWFLIPAFILGVTAAIFSSKNGTAPPQFHPVDSDLLE